MWKSALLVLFMASCSVDGRTVKDPGLLVEDLALSKRPVSELPWPAGTPQPTDEEIRRAHKGAGALYDLGLEAFPSLLAGLKDKRLSVPWEALVLDTVQSTCGSIIGSHVDPHLPKMYRVTYEFLWHPDLTVWWQERSGWTLKDLKAEALRYCIAMAEHNSDEKVKEELISQFKALEAGHWEHGIAIFREYLPTLKIPEDPEALVRCLEISGETYLKQRFAAERAWRAEGQLSSMKEKAFPLLVRFIKDPKVGEACFRILQYQVEDHTAILYPRFRHLRRNSIEAWWSRSKGKPLAELQSEAAKHALAKAREYAFLSPEERENCLEVLQSIVEDPPE